MSGKFSDQSCPADALKCRTTFLAASCVIVEVQIQGDVAPWWPITHTFNTCRSVLQAQLTGRFLALLLRGDPVAVAAACYLFVNVTCNMYSP